MVNSTPTAPLLYQGYYKGANIEKHAAVPITRMERYTYTDELDITHNEFPVKIKFIQPELKQQYKDYQKKHEDASTNEFLTTLKIANVKCPNNHEKMLYEQILGNTYEDEALVYCSCAHTAMAAMKRQVRKVAYPDKQVIKDWYEHSVNIIEKELGEQLNNFTYSFKDWMNKLDTNKYKQMEEFGNIYHGRKESLEYSVRKVQEMIDTNFKSLVKIELQKKDGKPRMICQTPMCNKYIMGPVTLKLEEICGEYLQGYCKGQSVVEMAREFNQNIKDGFCYIAQGDMSGYDGSQHVLNKGIDRYIYRRIAGKVYHADKEEFVRLATSHRNKIMIQYRDDTNKLRDLALVDILGTVFSGASDTTLMNTIRTALYVRYVNDKYGLVYGVDYKCLCKGDDFIVFYKNKPDENELTKHYYKFFLKSAPLGSLAEFYDDREYGLGQVLKFLKIGDYESLDYLSLTAFYKNEQEQEIVLMRNPEKFNNLSRYSRKTKFMSRIEKINYLVQQAVALQATYGGLQVFDRQAELYIEKAKSLLNETGCSDEKIKSIIMKCKGSKVSNVIRKFYSLVEENENNRRLYDIGELKNKKRKPDGMDYWDWVKMEQSHIELTEDEEEYVNKKMAIVYC